MEKRYIFPKAMHAVLLIIFNHSLQTAPLLTAKGPLPFFFFFWKPNALKLNNHELILLLNIHQRLLKL